MSAETGQSRGREIVATISLILAACVVTGCAPLTNELSSYGSCLVAITADSGSGQTVYSGHDLAQSFIVPLATSVSTVSISLNAVSTNNTTHPSGSITLAIVPDAISTTSSPTATTPVYSPLGGITNIATLDASALTLNQAAFYTFTLPSPVSLIAQAYWVYDTYGGPNSTPTVVWEATSSQVYPLGFAYVGSAVLSPMIDLLTLINC